MIKFNTERLGNVVLKFRHNLPQVTLAPRNNSLASMVNGIKMTQGNTECEIQVDVLDGYPAYVFFGNAFTHPNDMYKKETGRLLSLTRAIEYGVTEGLISEADGRAIMAGYYNR